MKRRDFLKMSLYGGGLIMVSGSGLIVPRQAWAGPNLQQAFAAQSEDEALKHLFAQRPITASSALHIQAPVQADGDSVPIVVKTELDQVALIAILTQRNVPPLNSVIQTDYVKGYFRTVIKMRHSSPVTAYALSGDKVFSASTKIKVSRGGYGMQY